MKCFVCKTGNLTASGCNEYCDNCSFSRFIVTDLYIDSCIVVLAELVSNTKFDNEQALRNFVRNSITSHLPKLNEFMFNFTGEVTPFTNALVDGIKAQAVNLHIGEEVHNFVEKGRDLRCSCGNEQNFTAGPMFPEDVICDACHAVFAYNEKLGTYEPEFLCECGNMTWTLLDDITGLCECKECNTAFIHNHSDKIFTMLTANE
jgi:hypothetical protein